MVVYFVVAFGIVALISIVFSIRFNKNKLLSFHTVLAISLSSLIISFAMPFIFGRFLPVSQNGQVDFGFGMMMAIAVPTGIYLVTLLLSTVLISVFIPSAKEKELEESAKNGPADKVKHKKQDLLSLVREQSEREEEEQEGAIHRALEADQNDLSQKQIDITMAQEENIFEKPVDRAQNIDKMGVETIKIGDFVEEPKIGNIEDEFIDDSLGQNGNDATNPDELEMGENFGLNLPQQGIQYINVGKNADNNDDSAIEPLTIEEHIDKAFKLKMEGNFEEAILNYMVALDKGPEKDLVFWIILDICVLYKNLGQVELAEEILQSYISNYGELMDESLRLEIERNLSYA